VKVPPVSVTAAFGATSEPRKVTVVSVAFVASGAFHTTLLAVGPVNVTVRFDIEAPVPTTLTRTDELAGAVMVMPFACASVALSIEKTLLSVRTPVKRAILSEPKARVPVVGCCATMALAACTWGTSEAKSIGFSSFKPFGRGAAVIENEPTKVVMPPTEPVFSVTLPPEIRP
jgi:hypothetical protein